MNTDLVVLQPPVVFTDDVNQEAELVRLQGKTPNKNLIKKRLSTEGYSTYGTVADLHNGQFRTPWQTDEDSLEATRRLLQWALSQSIIIQKLIFEFLENPEPERLEEILGQLQASGISLFRSPPKVTKTATSVILDSLPATLTELAEAIRIWSPNTKRPEATVRQTLRRLIRTGKAYESRGQYFKSPS